MNIIVSALKGLLIKQGVSQADLAKATNQTEVSVSRYMNGQREPKIGVTMKMADALGCRLVLVPKVENEKRTIDKTIQDLVNDARSMNITNGTYSMMRGEYKVDITLRK